MIGRAIDGARQFARAVHLYYRWHYAWHLAWAKAGSDVRGGLS